MQLLNPKSNLFQEIKFEAPKSKAKGVRGLLIQDFVIELNKSAGQKYKVGTEWKVTKEVKPSYVAFRLSHLKVPDLFYFLSCCKSAKCGFSRAFYGGLKSKQ